MTGWQCLSPLLIHQGSYGIVQACGSGLNRQQPPPRFRPRPIDLFLTDPSHIKILYDPPPRLTLRCLTRSPLLCIGLRGPARPPPTCVGHHSSLLKGLSRLPDSILTRSDCARGVRRRSHRNNRLTTGHLTTTTPSSTLASSTTLDTLSLSSDGRIQGIHLFSGDEGTSGPGSIKVMGLLRSTPNPLLEPDDSLSCEGVFSILNATKKSFEELLTNSALECGSVVPSWSKDRHCLLPQYAKGLSSSV